jgi:hypothetical protein
MGWVRDGKAEVLASEAKRVWGEGSPVFIAVLNEPGSRVGWSGEVKDWTLMVAAVEQVGWKLDQWSVGSDPKGKPQAYPVFQRP